MRVMLLSCICKNSAAIFALTGLSDGWSAFLGSSIAELIGVAIFHHERNQSIWLRCGCSITRDQGHVKRRRFGLKEARTSVGFALIEFRQIL
jgi:hypothetical protein